MASQKLGVKAEPKAGAWVQTERSAHEAWAKLVASKPRAAQLLHILVARMGHQNAVVVSQKVLAEMMGCSTDTVQRAVKALKDQRWLQVVKIGRGKEVAYVVNDRVAWGAKRTTMQHLSVFSAHVIADQRDQDPETLEGPDLRKIPVMYPGELQMPSGPSDDPPTQQCIPTMEHDLPARRVHSDENLGFDFDAETGEIYDK